MCIVHSTGEAMNSHVCEAIKKELAARGYSEAGESPNGTMTLDDEYLRSVEVVELIDQLISRREKIFKSGDVVGLDNARRGYDDVVMAVDALKAVISCMDLRR